MSSEVIQLSRGDSRDLSKMLGDVAKHFAELPNIMEETDLKRHLRNARDIQRALDSLSNALQSSIPFLAQKLSNIPIRENLPSLPDEILAIIFRLSETGTAFWISQVCRRFRSIVFSIPELWTVIRSSDMHNLDLAHLSVYAERSRIAGLGLTLELCPHGYFKRTGYVKTFMTFIDMQSARIRDLTLHLEVMAMIEDKNAYSKLSLPSLETLKIVATRTSSPPHSYNRWSVPSLRNLHGVNCAPDFPTHVLAKVKAYTFETPKDRCSPNAQVTEEWSVGYLSRYLNGLSSLEELKLDVHCKPWDLYLLESHSNLKVDIKTLRSLSITLQHDDYTCRYAEKIFKMFDYEDLTALSINIPNNSLRDITRLLKSVGCPRDSEKFDSPHLPSLKDLDFRIRPAFYNIDHGPISPRMAVLMYFFAGGYSLENLYMECAEDDHQTFDSSNRLAAIRMKNCRLFKYSTGEGDGPDIIHDIEDRRIVRTRGEAMNHCLVLDGAKANPLEEVEIIKVPTITNRGFCVHNDLL